MLCIDGDRLSPALGATKGEAEVLDIGMLIGVIDGLGDGTTLGNPLGKGARRTSS